MYYCNARIFCEDFQFRTGAFQVANGRFGEVLPAQIPADAIDLRGAVVLPGLVDVHLHGAVGADVSDADPQGLRRMAAYLAENGVTSFVPATMTLPYENLSSALKTAGELAQERPEGCARLLGVHMEGPYFSEKKKGAQNGAYLRQPDYPGFRQLQKCCGGLIKIVDVAPELPGALEFISQAKELATVSVAHTDADYDQARAAFEAGATHLTHLFNAMPSIHHRKPGVIPAAAENPGVRAEIISDGQHVHPAAVRMAFRLFGGERMVLVSDSGRCCGMPDGSSFELGGQIACLTQGIARLPDGTIACSATNLFECLRRAISFGVPARDAIRAAAWNPACAVGAEREVGAIAPGLRADFLVCDGDFNLQRVFLEGKEINRNQKG